MQKMIEDVLVDNVVSCCVNWESFLCCLLQVKLGKSCVMHLLCGGLRMTVLMGMF
jgi:hypothetical protein